MAAKIFRRRHQCRNRRRRHEEKEFAKNAEIDGGNAEYREVCDRKEGRIASDEGDDEREDDESREDDEESHSEIHDEDEGSEV